MSKFISWCWKHKKYGIPLLLIPIIFIFKSLGGLSSLFKAPDQPAPMKYTPKQAERERERITEHKDAKAKEIESEADKARADVEEWLSGR